MNTMTMVASASTFHRGAGSKPGIDPCLQVVEEIFHAVGILTGNCFTSGARSDAVSGPLDDDEVLIPAGRHIIMDFVVAYEIVAPHGGNEDGNRNLPKSATGGVIAGALIDFIHGIGGSNRIGTQEGSNRQQVGPAGKSGVPVRGLRAHPTYTLDYLTDQGAVVL